MKQTVLIIDSFAKEGLKNLKDMGFSVDYRPDISPDHLSNFLASAYGLIVRSKVSVDKKLLSTAPALRFVARAGAGTENIDLLEAQARGICVLHAAEGNADALAEHTMGLLLSLFHRLSFAHQDIREGCWRREAHRGEEIKGKTVSILGFGYMGRAFALRLQAFGVKVYVYDRHTFKTSAGQVQAASLDKIYAETDILSIHIHASQENTHFINEHFLSHFQKPIYLINTARGSVLSYEALCKGLQQGRIRGAALDVMENEHLTTLSTEEKKRFDYLSTHPNVILTPHVAGWTKESFVRIAKVLTEKIRLFTQHTHSTSFLRLSKSIFFFFLYLHVYLI